MSKINVAHFEREYLRVTETFIFNQIKSLKNNSNFEPLIFCKKFNNNFNDNEIIPFIVTENLTSFNKVIDNLSYDYFKHLTTKAVDNIIKQLNVKEIKLLHFHYLVDARFFIDVIKKSKLPCIVSAYGWDVSNFPKKYFGLGKKYLEPTLKEIDYIIAMSEDMKKDLLLMGVPEHKIVIHYHGINIKRFIYKERKYDDKNRINILFCGRLVYKKAPDLILKSLKIIKEKKLTNVSFKFTIVGEGVLRNLIESLVKEYALGDIVDLLGHIPHHSEKFLDEYRKADILVQPSQVSKNDKEGIPGTLIEAMASGLPVVSTYHAGIPEIIESGVNGLLVKEGDCEELAQKISILMNNTTLRKKLGINAQEKVKELDLESKTEKLEEIYYRVINEHKMKEEAKIK